MTHIALWPCPVNQWLLTNVYHGHFKKKLKLIGASVNFWQASEWRKPWFFLCKIFKLHFFAAEARNQIGSKIHIFYTLGLKLYMVTPSICVHRLVYSNPKISTKKGDIQGGCITPPPRLLCNSQRASPDRVWKNPLIFFNNKKGSNKFL